MRTHFAGDIQGSKDTAAAVVAPCGLHGAAAVIPVMAKAREQLPCDRGLVDVPLLLNDPTSP